MMIYKMHFYTISMVLTIEAIIVEGMHALTKNIGHAEILPFGQEHLRFWSVRSPVLTQFICEYFWKHYKMPFYTIEYETM